MKINTNDMLQLRRSYKTFSPNVCLLCMESGKIVDHIFLYCPLILGLWHRLFSLVHVDWVPPRSICNIMNVSYRGLGNTNTGKVLWKLVCLALMWIMWLERNARIFEDKAGSSVGLGS